MATGTEVAVTKLMWALGYHVPENHIAYLRREQLVIGEGAKFTPPGRNAARDAAERHRQPAAARQPRAGRVLPRRGQQGAAGQAGRARAVRGHAAGRPERHRAAPGSPRAARLRRLRRLAESRRRESDQFAGRAGHRKWQIVRASLPDRLRLGARQRRSRAGRLLGGLGVSRSAARRREADGELRVRVPKWRTTPFYEASAIGPPAAATTPISIPNSGSRACRTRRSCTRDRTTSSGRRRSSRR